MTATSNGQDMRISKVIKKAIVNRNELNLRELMTELYLCLIKFPAAVQVDALSITTATTLEAPNCSMIAINSLAVYSASTTLAFVLVAPMKYGLGVVTR